MLYLKQLRLFWRSGLFCVSMVLYAMCDALYMKKKRFEPTKLCKGVNKKQKALQIENMVIKKVNDFQYPI